MFFDTHAHYDDEAFDADREEVLAALPASGVCLVVNPGCDGDSSRTAVALSERFAHVYAAVGWHPQAAEHFDENALTLLRRLAGGKKVVAIGEIGLDYYYEGPSREAQQTAFTRQMELARELKLPVIVHDREAHGACMDVVRAFPEVRGVFHCYSGSAEMAQELVRLGWYVSFTGAVTFKNARRALEAIEALPLERIMLETDAPYLAPVPHRGKRNDSRLLPYVAQAVAQVKGISPEQAAQAALENGKRFFSI